MIQREATQWCFLDQSGKGGTERSYLIGIKPMQTDAKVVQTETVCGVHDFGISIELLVKLVFL